MKINISHTTDSHRCKHTRTIAKCLTLIIAARLSPSVEHTTKANSDFNRSDQTYLNLNLPSCSFHYDRPQTHMALDSTYSRCRRANNTLQHKHSTLLFLFNLPLEFSPHLANGVLKYIPTHVEETATALRGCIHYGSLCYYVSPGQVQRTWVGWSVKVHLSPIWTSGRETKLPERVKERISYGRS